MIRPTGHALLPGRLQGRTGAACLGGACITTDGSSLYPKVLARPVVAGGAASDLRLSRPEEITKAVLHALAKLRKELAAQIPKLPPARPRGRAATPGQGVEGENTQGQRLKQRLALLFEHRYLFVRRHLSKVQKKVLALLVRGRPQLRVLLREIMEEVYRLLFDRRCRTATALEKLDKLRKRVRRFKKLGKGRRRARQCGTALTGTNNPSLFPLFPRVFKARRSLSAVFGSGKKDESRL